MSTPNFDNIAEGRAKFEKFVAQVGTTITSLGGPAATPEDLAAMARTKAVAFFWLERWETSFAAFLAREAGNSDIQTLNGYRLLKLHHIAFGIFIEVDHSEGEASWAKFTSRLKAVVDLADEILQGTPRRSVGLQAPQEPYVSSSMGLAEPLYQTVSRCADPEIVERARGLMAKLPASDGANSAWRMAYVEKILSACTGKPYIEGDSTSATPMDASAGSSVAG
ncbi:uncharacterized protein LTR77_007857 [Saxophila tyrrhenica]|uniref:Uncharacterized protein n=1 Tax=Saxophila tyrrhenica TaxID=1690608 RepID=A0AAV9P6K1_9PEZI|nr:hypothetical protein LTR77_007857 [Saxophila tyrrhenica]